MSQAGILNFSTTPSTPDQVVIRGPVVDFLVTGNTNIFTFPNRFVLTGMAFLNVTLTGSVNSDGVANLGWTAAAYSDIVGGIASSTYPTELLFEAGGFIPSGINNFMVIPAATTVVLRIVSADTGPSVYTNRVDLYGYYY